MHTVPPQQLSTGFPSLDSILEEVKLGDNIVWLVSSAEQYDYFTARWVNWCVQQPMRLLYVHFDQRIDYSELAGAKDVHVLEVNPEAGRREVVDRLQPAIREHPAGTHYLFDNLSVLAARWGDEELVGFFRSTCPLLFQREAVAYFALLKGGQSNDTVAKIRDTTQILLDIYEEDGRVFLKPIKVWDRYSERMFQPHMLSGGQFIPAEALRETRERPEAGAEAHLLAGYRSHPTTDSPASIREELIRSIISTRPEYIRVARDCFSVEDLVNVRHRIVGSGVIGGKAAGMLLSERILWSACQQGDGQRWAGRITVPESYYIGSGVYFNFLINNNLMHWLDVKYGTATQVRERYGELRRAFEGGEFPRPIRQELRRVVRALGDGPIIVRSSSLLEDSFEMAFAGKYESVFLGNQGPLEDRVGRLLEAVRQVYASSLGPDALTYRRRRGLLEFQEHMAVLIQRVQGSRYRNLHFPPAAGVAFSRNPYPWNERIDAAEGLVRLVFGLGTRAVDRVEDDYPRLIALSHPDLHPDGDYMSSPRYHQRKMDAINLESNRLETLSVRDHVGADYPHMRYVFSLYRDGFLQAPVVQHSRFAAEELTVTFQNLVTRTDFVELARYVLHTVESRYRFPVDVEFALGITDAGRPQFCLLQCRPLSQRTEFQPAHLPEGLPPERVLFTARKAVPNGELHGLRYIALIDSRSYDAVPTDELRTRLARAVGAINQLPQLQQEGYILIGPGRWGSVNIRLGVPVTYSEINNARLLMEMAREKDGYTPEVSYGTHFFQDLVEAEIFYLPLYPDAAGCVYNEEFFRNARNELPKLLPRHGNVAEYIKLIDVPPNAGGLWAHVAMNREESLATGYLAPPRD